MKWRSTSACLPLSFATTRRRSKPPWCQGAVLKLMGLTDALQKEPVSRIQSGLNTLMAAINHGLLEATNGLLDVRTLAGCSADVRRA